jgi:hypothetical protein
MRQPLNQYWQDLLSAIEREANAFGGLGDLVFRVRFHEGQPREIVIQDRVPRYRLGKTEGPPKGS